MDVKEMFSRVGLESSRPLIGQVGFSHVIPQHVEGKCGAEELPHRQAVVPCSLP